MGRGFLDVTDITLFRKGNTLSFQLRSLVKNVWIDSGFHANKLLVITFWYLTSYVKIRIVTLISAMVMYTILLIILLTYIPIF